MLRRFIFASLALTGGAIGAQVPEFQQQYTQRLAGKLDAVRARAKEIRIDAAAQGLSTDAYIERFTASPAHALEGDRMAASLMEEVRLSHVLEALETSGNIGQHLNLIRHFDPLLAGRKTAHTFAESALEFLSPPYRLPPRG